jgi:IS30 family transposase
MAFQVDRMRFLKSYSSTEEAMSYNHVSAKERHTLMFLDQMKLSRREIGRRLNRHHTTISRELKRNGRLFDWCYWDEAAEEKAVARKQQPRHRKRREHAPLYDLVLSDLQQGWSPDAISGWLALHYKNSPKMQVSPETIYQWIYQDAAEGGSLYLLLHSTHKKRKKQRVDRLKKVLIPYRVSIECRPAGVEKRARIGHWEGDTVEGAKGTGGLATHVERKSRFMLSERLADKTAKVFSQMTQQAFADIPQRLCKTLTLDNGTENTLHQEISAAKNMKVFFADPYSPWQRGTNEQTNGLLRRYFPKGTDFRDVTDVELQRVITIINQRPRKSLNYRSPEEVFFSAMGGAL